MNTSRAIRMKIRDQKKRVAFLEEENERLKKRVDALQGGIAALSEKRIELHLKGLFRYKHQSSAERTMNQLHHSEEIANEELAQAVRARDSIMSHLPIEYFLALSEERTDIRLQEIIHQKSWAARGTMKFNTPRLRTG